MNPTDELLKEFRETHNQIVQSLNDAEKGHAETLAVFIAELEKRKSAIDDVNQGISRFNHLISTMATGLASTNKRINDLDVLSRDIEFKLKHLQENVSISLKQVSKDVFRDFFKKTKYIFILNLICMSVLIFVALK